MVLDHLCGSMSSILLTGHAYSQVSQKRILLTLSHHSVYSVSSQEKGDKGNKLTHTVNYYFMHGVAILPNNKQTRTHTTARAMY